MTRTETITMKHTIGVESDGNRCGAHYGEYMYVERAGGHVVKSEYLGRDFDHACAAAWGVAQTYGAKYIGGRERDCFSAD